MQTSGAVLRPLLSDAKTGTHASALPVMQETGADRLIRQLGLEPLPMEGGYFRVTYTSDEQIMAEALPGRYGKTRNIAGAIYYLTTSESFSAMHRLKSDELYYYHLGDAAQMLFLYPDGSGEIRLLGPDIDADQQLQLLAPRDCWHGSRPLPGGQHGFSLLSTSMAPGFDESDVCFESGDILAREYPEFSSLIRALTRI